MHTRVHSLHLSHFLSCTSRHSYGCHVRNREQHFPGASFVKSLHFVDAPPVLSSRSAFAWRSPPLSSLCFALLTMHTRVYSLHLLHFLSMLHVAHGAAILLSVHGVCQALLSSCHFASLTLCPSQLDAACLLANTFVTLLCLADNASWGWWPASTASTKVLQVSLSINWVCITQPGAS